MSKIIVDSEARIDVYLSNFLKESRAQVSELIKNQNVILNNKLAKPSSKVQIGDEIIINLPEVKEKTIKYEAKFDVEIIYEDEDLIVVNKPSGVATHGASSLKEASLVEWLLQQNYSLCNLNGDIRAGIVHRLDKDTSGALIVAKNNDSYINLAEQIKNRFVSRIYLAIIDLPITHNYVEKYINRNPNNRLKMLSLSEEECKNKFLDNKEKWGRWSKTYFLNIDSVANMSLIAAKLESGRTHQIRSHLASVNRYILGDSIYAPKNIQNKASRLMLHSFSLSFNHPKSGRMLSFIAPFDAEFANMLSNFKEEVYDENYSNKLISCFSNKF